MRIELIFKDSEARVAEHYLRARYNSRAGFVKLAKLAIREEVARQAEAELAALRSKRAMESLNEASQ